MVNGINGKIIEAGSFQSYQINQIIFKKKKKKKKTEKVKTCDGTRANREESQGHSREQVNDK